MNRNRDLKRALTVAGWLLSSLAGLVPAFAQDPGPGLAGFRIEAITVQGVEREAARNIVSGETRLRTGAVYDEAAVVQAIHRVKRLPFVLDAGYELRAGSAPGAYELIVTVQTYSPLTGTLDVFGAGELYDFDTFSVSSLRVRGFVGGVTGQGLAFGSVQKPDGGDPSGQLGYTQYGLLGDGSSATLVVTRPFTNDTLDSVEADLSVRLPITPNNTLRAGYRWARTDYDAANIADIDFQETFHAPSLEWLYDTTDDPLLTLSGTQLSGRASYLTQEQEDDLTSDSTSAVVLGVSGRHYLPVAARQSFGFLLESTYQDLDDRDFAAPKVYTYAAEVGYFSSFWESKAAGHPADLRWESRARYDRRDLDYGSLGSRAEDVLSLSTGLIFRTRWVILRGLVSYFEAV